MAAEDIDYGALWEKAEAAASAAEGGSAETPAAPVAARPVVVAPAEDDSVEVPSDDADDSEPADKGENAPTPKERAEFRAWKRKQLARIEASKREVAELAAKELEALKPIRSAADALKARDLDGFAKLVGEQLGLDVSDWSGLNKHILRQHTSPEYQEVQELRRDKIERERKEREQAQRAEVESAKQQQAAARTEYQKRLQGELKGIEGPSAILAEDAEFVRAVFAVQMREYDQSTDSTVSAKEAAEEVLKVARQRYELQHRAFNGTQPVKPGEKHPPGKPAKKRTISGASVEASAKGSPKTDQEWRNKFAAMLQAGD